MSCAPESIRTREVVVQVYNTTRSLGELPTHIHTDIRALVQCYARDAKWTNGRRGQTSKRVKRVNLSSERIDRVERALRDAAARGVAPYMSLRCVRDAVYEWYAVMQEWSVRDVLLHYDEKRAGAYHAHNAGSQDVLTERTMELAMYARWRDNDATTSRQDDETSPMLLLDIGCGTGLSTTAAVQRGGGCGCFGIGVDTSEDMLVVAADEARRRSNESMIMSDYVCCDAGSPLPFRADCFDLVLSISALHYIARRRRTELLFRELLRCTHVSIREDRHNDEVAMQFFPESAAEARDAAKDALAAGWKTAVAVCDSPHNNGAKRWFLLASSSSPSSSQPPKSEEEEEENTATTSTQPMVCPLFGAPCCLSYIAFRESRAKLACHIASSSSLSHSPFNWLIAEHLRYARRLIRRLNYADAAESREASESGTKATDFDREERALALRLRHQFGANVTHEDLLRIPTTVINALHSS